jgi:hypothetical protein
MHVASYKAAHNMAVSAVVDPVKNTVSHVADSPGASAALWFYGPIGWAALAWPW